ncbi:MAG TPA: hypothetical protein VHY08_17315 [Bacillota bacterium]|nr:hypothetical protein [Bacillota bacterium]
MDVDKLPAINLKDTPMDRKSGFFLCMVSILIGVMVYLIFIKPEHSFNDLTSVGKNTEQITEAVKNNYYQEAPSMIEKRKQYNKFVISGNLGGEPEAIPGQNGGKNFYVFAIPVESLSEGEKPVWVEAIVTREDLFPRVQSLKTGSFVKITNSRLQFKVQKRDGCRHRVLYPKLYVYDFEVIETGTNPESNEEAKAEGENKN